MPEGGKLFDIEYIVVEAIEQPLVNRTLELVAGEEARLVHFKEIAARIGVDTKRGADGSNQARVIGQEVDLGEYPRELDFLFKDSFVGMGLTEIFFFVNHYAVLDNGNNAALPIFGRVAEDDLVEKKITRLAARKGSQKRGQRFGLFKVFGRFNRVIVAFGEADLAIPKALGIELFEVIGAIDGNSGRVLGQDLGFDELEIGFGNSGKEVYLSVDKD